MNPECPDCHETMFVDDPAEVAFDYLPGSPEIRSLFALSSMGIKNIWHCLGCGHFELAEHPPRA